LFALHCIVDKNRECESISLLVPLVVVSVIAGVAIIVAVVLLIIAIKLRAGN